MLSVYHQRKSHTLLGKIYFWTATIHQWRRLFENDDFKDVIMAYLKKLSDEDLLTIYAFVIMQRDSLGVEIYSSHVATQKSDYIRVNPVK